MVKIRLSRLGSKGRPVYRVVAIDNSKKVGGKPLEILGFWNPQDKVVKINKEKLNNWLKKGAKLSPKISLLIK